MPNTAFQEMTLVWDTMVVPNYPDQQTILNALTLGTWTANTTNDEIANFLAKSFVAIRNSGVYGWTIPLTTAQKKSLYDEIDSIMTEAYTNLGTIQSAIHTAYLAM